tara:strand:+ start:646 stop:858 length:213 start_codon:yes stop_codon:yes gene_type:complete
VGWTEGKISSLDLDLWLKIFSFSFFYFNFIFLKKAESLSAPNIVISCSEQFFFACVKKQVWSSDTGASWI